MGNRIGNKDWFLIVDDDDSVISIRIRRRDMKFPLAERRARKVLRGLGIKVTRCEDLGIREVSLRVFEPEKRGNARCWDIRFHTDLQNP